VVILDKNKNMVALYVKNSTQSCCNWLVLVMAILYDLSAADAKFRTAQWCSTGNLMNIFQTFSNVNQEQAILVLTKNSMVILG